MFSFEQFNRCVENYEEDYGYLWKLGPEELIREIACDLSLLDEEVACPRGSCSRYEGRCIETLCEIIFTHKIKYKTVVVEFILTRGIPIDDYLVFQCVSGSREILDLLIKYLPKSIWQKANDHGDFGLLYELMECSNWERPETKEYFVKLLDVGVDPLDRSFRRTILDIFIESADVEWVKYIILRWPNYDYSPILNNHNVYQGYTIVKKKKINYNRNSLLECLTNNPPRENSVTTTKNIVEIIKLCIKHGLDVNYVDNDSKTLYDYLCMYGWKELLSTELTEFFNNNLLEKDKQLFIE